MNDRSPDTLDRLLNDVPIGPAPMTDLLLGGRTAERRRRRIAVSGALAGIVVLCVAVGLVPFLSGESGERPVADQPTPGTASHQVKVLSRLEGPSNYYFEGAMVQALLEPTDAPSNTETQHPSAPQWVGRTTIWPDVTEGAWRLTASTRVCNGNCGEPAPPTDTCTLDLNITQDTTVLVTYRWGRTCHAEVLSQDEVAVPAVVGLPPNEAATILRSSSLAVEVEAKPCPPTWDCVDGVFRSNPPSGTPVEPGTAVTLFVPRH